MPLKSLVSGRLREAAGKLERLLSWWRAELEGAWVDWSARNGGRGQILCTHDELVLSRKLSSGSVTLARMPRSATPAGLPELIRTVLGQNAAAFRTLEIVLPAEAVLRRRAHFPAAVGRRLREAVGFQLERLMPLKATLVYFGCTVISQQETCRRLLVEIVEARRILVDEMANSALAAGVRRVSLVCASATVEGRAIALLDRSGPNAASNLTPVDRWLGWSVIALALAFAILSLVQYHAENAHLATRVQALKVRATAADNLRDTLQTRVDRIHFLAGRVNGPDAAAVLAELTRLLPTDAWVFQFQAEGDQLHIAGFAKDASALSAELSKSPMFIQVSLRSAVKAPGSDSERFDIALRLKSTGRS